MNMRSIYHQSGFSLTEALVAFAVVAGGLLAIASFQAGLFTNSAYNKAQTEALSLAQQKIEELRHYPFADESNYIDEDGDGVMDADGEYQDAAIVGNNAQYLRTWTITTTDDIKRIDVNVGWVDARGENQSVSLPSTLTYLSPRSGADQLAELSEPLVPSPTGRAEIGDGTLDDYPSADLTQISSTGSDGLSTYQYQDDLFLVDPSNNVVLRLRDACSSTTGICTDFVKISGTVYLDKRNLSGGGTQATDILVIASNAAHCQRWTDTGSLESPPATANGDYEYFNYTCYFGGGWFGNIGFLTTAGLKQSDKVCQGDPTSLDEWADPVIALRRAYRGMIKRTGTNGTEYYSHGIADAAQVDGQDFVFTSLAPERTQGSYCVGSDAPMTRGDSAGGKLFAGTPVDFVCLNNDVDGDSLPDYLDAYDTSRFTADASCPYDPTDPPVLSHRISGNINVLAAGTPDLSAFKVVTSDGTACEFVSPFASGGGGASAQYACTVWDWGDGWTGVVQVRPNTTDVFCDPDTATFTNTISDQTHNFSCISSNTITIGGSLIYDGVDAPVSGLAIKDIYSGYQGVCRFNDNAYTCALPYSGFSTDFTLTVQTTGHVCGALESVYSFFGASKEGSPYAHDIVITSGSAVCPLVAVIPNM